MAFCGFSVDVDSYNRYKEIRAMLGPYVHEPGRQGTLPSNLDEVVRRHLQELGTDWVCRGQAFPFAKDFFREETASARIDVLRQRLRTKTDPDEGDCVAF
jgi:hypothetical protein